MKKITIISVFAVVLISAFGFASINQQSNDPTQNQAEIKKDSEKAGIVETTGW